FADERLVRVDAGGDRISRPKHAPSSESVADALRLLSDFSVESVFVEGSGGNTNEYDVEEWIDRLAALHPEHVTVRPAAEPPLDPDRRRADAATLERIARRLHERTGLAATALP